MPAPAIKDGPLRADQSQDRQSQRRLARAGFADDADGLALAHGQRNAVDRLHVADGAAQKAVLDREPYAHVVGGRRSAWPRRRLPAARPWVRPRAASWCIRAADWRRRRAVLPASTMRPFCITATSLAILRTMPRSWVMNSIAMPSRACRSFNSLRICACTVTSSAVVGSSAMKRSGRLASAIAIITRWRWPPES